MDNKRKYSPCFIEPRDLQKESEVIHTGGVMIAKLDLDVQTEPKEEGPCSEEIAPSLIDGES